MNQLKTTTSISYRTRQVKRLLEGRPATPDKPPIVGLIRFGQLATDIYKAAALNNPYAHQYLLQIEDGFKRVLNYIEVKNKELDQLMRPGIEPGDVINGSKRDIAARFSAPFGYQAAYILQDGDAYIARIINMGHVGLIPPKQKNLLLEQCCRKLRGMLESVAGWKLFQITCDDISNSADNDLVRRAATHFKFELDPMVVSGELRAEYAPTYTASSAKPATRGSQDLAATETAAA